jgi:hypothetical protein
VLTWAFHPHGGKTSPSRSGILLACNCTILDGKYVGGIAGSAGKGAAAGAAVGALVKGETVTIPPGAMLEFTLRAPATLPAAGGA